MNVFKEAAKDLAQYKYSVLAPEVLASRHVELTKAVAEELSTVMEDKKFKKWLNAMIYRALTDEVAKRMRSKEFKQHIQEAAIKLIGEKHETTKS